MLMPVMLYVKYLCGYIPYICMPNFTHIMSQFVSIFVSATYLAIRYEVEILVSCCSVYQDHYEYENKALQTEHYTNTYH